MVDSQCPWLIAHRQVLLRDHLSDRLATNIGDGGTVSGGLVHSATDSTPGCQPGGQGRSARPCAPQAICRPHSCSMPRPRACRRAATWRRWHSCAGRAGAAVAGPGLAELNHLLGGLGTLCEILALAGFVISSGVWALAHHGGNHYGMSAGRRG